MLLSPSWRALWLIVAQPILSIMPCCHVFAHNILFILEWPLSSFKPCNSLLSSASLATLYLFFAQQAPWIQVLCLKLWGAFPYKLIIMPGPRELINKTRLKSSGFPVSTPKFPSLTPFLLFSNYMVPFSFYLLTSHLIQLSLKLRLRP